MAFCTISLMGRSLACAAEVQRVQACGAVSAWQAVGKLWVGRDLVRRVFTLQVKAARLHTG